MRRINASRPSVASTSAAVLVAALIGASFLSPAATSVARAQTEPITAANGVLLPPADYDPAAARNEDLASIAVAPATATPPVESADASTVTDASEATTEAPEIVTETPEEGNAVTTSLGGSDVTVSSVGGSHEVDRPKKRSERKR